MQRFHFCVSLNGVKELKFSAFLMIQRRYYLRVLHKRRENRRESTDELLNKLVAVTTIIIIIHFINMHFL